MDRSKASIGELIGEASMCWSELPGGVFETQRASEIVAEIERRIALDDTARACVTALERIAAAIERDRTPRPLTDDECDALLRAVGVIDAPPTDTPDPTGYPPTKRVWATFDAVRYALGAMVREHRMTTKRGDFFHVDYAEDALAAYDAAMKGGE